MDRLDDFTSTLLDQIQTNAAHSRPSLVLSCTVSTLLIPRDGVSEKKHKEQKRRSQRRGPLGRPKIKHTYESAQDWEPHLQDRDHAELARGAEYNSECARELVLLLVLMATRRRRERIEGVPKAYEGAVRPVLLGDKVSVSQTGLQEPRVRLNLKPTYRLNQWRPVSPSLATPARLPLHHRLGFV